MRSMKTFMLALASVALVQACGKSGFSRQPDGATGSGGALGSEGGTTGELAGTGGTNVDDTSVGTGGLFGRGGTPGMGGTTPRGGVTGALGTGGIIPGTGGDYDDGGSSACSCEAVGDAQLFNAATTSWDCYCSAYSCDTTLAGYEVDGGLGRNVLTITEYADCGLAVVRTQIGADPALDHAFDMVTGRLVGEQRGSDVPSRCPFDDASTYHSLSAGQFPAPTCRVSACVASGSPFASCGNLGSGGSTGGTGGAGGAGGSGGTMLDGGGSCTCASGETTLDCFCSTYDCPTSLTAFTEGARAYSLLEEYAECNLVVVSTMLGISPDTFVFDRTTGGLVGERINADSVERCPFGGDAGFRMLSAGTFPASSCVRTRCEQGSLPSLRSCPDVGP